LFVHRFGSVAFFPVAGCVVGVVVLASLASRQWRAFGALPAPAANHPQPARDNV
jgi:hypothetical protein